MKELLKTLDKHGLPDDNEGGAPGQTLICK